MCNYEARIVSLLLPAVKIVSKLTKTHHFDNDTLICRTVQMSALLASATAATRESKQQQPPPRCTNSPLGCSALDYKVLPDDMSGLLYDCARQGKVNDIRFILDVWSWWRLHLACANGYVVLVRLLLSLNTMNVASNGSRNPGSTSLR
jgi:hypothetical protein